MGHEEGSHALLQHVFQVSFQPAALLEARQDVPLCQKMHVLHYATVPCRIPYPGACASSIPSSGLVANR